MPRNYVQNISLLGSTSRIETPFVKVTFGDIDSGYTFGVFQSRGIAEKDASGFYRAARIIYPNYIKSLTVEKINGQVNQYTLSMIYPIRPGDDPNFFEKIFSSISSSRKITFSYGDISVPDYVYRNEQAIITSISNDFNLQGSSISYTITAVSSAVLGYSGSYSFQGYQSKKPSDLIFEILQQPYYGLTDIFYGMRGKSSEELRALGLIPGDDAAVDIEAKTNISLLEYLKYLVNCMIPAGSQQQGSIYAFTVHDEVIGETTHNAKTETLGGPYFQIDRVDKHSEFPGAYELVIGSPSKDIVTAFSLSDRENYSIYYNWQGKLTQTTYVQRLNDKGVLEQEYAPVVSSGNEDYHTRSVDRVWWTKVTQYPISATVTIKGLLRPATLMQYVKLDVLFFGKKHISSGTYIVTKQTDSIDGSGYRTTLSLVRVAGESEEEYAA